MEIEVSFLSSNYSSVETIDRINNTDVEFIHIDVMDGIFVNNKTMPTNELVNLLKNTNKKLDIHLMVEDVEKYVNELSILKPNNITFHIELESNVNLMKYINLIKKLDCNVGLAINPDTDINKINPYLPFINQVLIMSVYPGQGGQVFIPSVLEKVSYLNKVKDSYNIKINIDGGINDKTIKIVRDYNLDYVVSGSFICKSDNYQNQIDLLK
ncbi:MAG: ribulose-phosphate 3-epimerase [Bacilli bacterium]|nr:ribulose-phosphate 3-epimerase [Bacilli bacterium]